MFKNFVRFYRDEDGPTAVEYAVLLALILVAVFSTISALGDSTHGIWASDSNQINAAVGGS
jgi:pilus assembly protein Flp/PilA